MVSQECSRLLFLYMCVAVRVALRLRRDPCGRGYQAPRARRARDPLPLPVREGFLHGT